LAAFVVFTAYARVLWRLNPQVVPGMRRLARTALWRINAHYVDCVSAEQIKLVMSAYKKEVNNNAFQPQQLREACEARDGLVAKPAYCWKE
jgi:hypothetical protein